MNIKEARQSVMGGGFFVQFMPISQRHTLLAAINGEEGGHFVELLTALRQRIETMPQTYETDGQGDEAVVYLHYFLGGIDAWVTEKDKGNGSNDQRQSQAFGKVCLTGNREDAELGYVNIEELIENGVELDLHWHMKQLKEI